MVQLGKAQVANFTIIVRSLCAHVRRCHTRIKQLKQRLRAAEEERDNFYNRSLQLQRDVEYYRQPARDREYCPGCGKSGIEIRPNQGTISYLHESRRPAGRKEV
jgi:hypothetical protein